MIDLDRGAGYDGDPALVHTLHARGRSRLLDVLLVVALIAATSLLIGLTLVGLFIGLVNTVGAHG